MGRCFRLPAHADLVFLSESSKCGLLCDVRLSNKDALGGYRHRIPLNVVFVVDLCGKQLTLGAVAIVGEE